MLCSPTIQGGGTVQDRVTTSNSSPSCSRYSACAPHHIPLQLRLGEQRAPEHYIALASLLPALLCVTSAWDKEEDLGWWAFLGPSAPLLMTPYDVPAILARGHRAHSDPTRMAWLLIGSTRHNRQFSVVRVFPAILAAVQYPTDALQKIINGRDVCNTDQRMNTWPTCRILRRLDTECVAGAERQLGKVGVIPEKRASVFSGHIPNPWNPRIHRGTGWVTRRTFQPGDEKQGDGAKDNNYLL